MRHLITVASAVLAAGCLASGCLAADEPPAEVPSRRDLRRSPVVEAFERTHGAVVNIASTRTLRVQRSPFDFFFHDIDELRRTPQERQTVSVGSGFVIHRAGYIVTNAHVVDRTSETKVIFDDNRTYDAQIVASEPTYDLALIRIEAREELPVIALGRSDDLMVGETVMAIGNPLGYQHTLTTGVISATSRDLNLYNEKTGQWVEYKDLIQTDASINPGSSGGPLLNVLGELIGINTAIRGDAENIGFAIPVHTLMDMLPAMLQAEQQGRFLLGARIDPQRRIASVTEGSPAARAGARVGDVVRAVGDQVVGSEMDYYMALIAHNPGDRLNMELERSGHTLPLRLVLQPPPRADGLLLAQKRLGVTIAQLPERVAREFGLFRRGGVLITELEPSGPAGVVGVRPGDVLTVLGSYYITSLDEVGQVLADTESGDRLRLRILRIEGNVAYRDETRVTLR